MAHVGCKILARVEHLRDVALGLYGRIGFGTLTWLGKLGGHGIHRHIGTVGIESHAQLLVDELQCTLGLEHVQRVLAELDVVGPEHGVVAPGAVVGIFYIVQELVDVAGGLVDSGRRDAAHPEPQCRCGHVAARVVVEHAVEVVAHVGVALVAAVVALIGEHRVGFFRHQRAVVVGAAAQQQQVAECALVAVIKHLVHQSDGHGIGCAARELVEYFLLVHYQHTPVVDLGMHVGDALRLLHEGLAGDNDHVGGGLAVNVLVVDGLPAGYAHQGVLWIEGDVLTAAQVLPWSEPVHDRCACCCCAVGYDVGRVVATLGRGRVVDVPHHQVAASHVLKLNAVGVGKVGKAHAHLALAAGYGIVVIVGEHHIVEVGIGHLSGCAYSQSHLARLAVTSWRYLPQGCGAVVVHSGRGRGINFVGCR